jgi:hypothetical protein
MGRGINYSFPNDPSVSSLTNFSYGASRTAALGDHLRKIDFSQHDYCVNEEVSIWRKESTTASAMNNLYAIIDAASQAGCQPIVMIFPTSTRANHQRPFEEAITSELLARGVPIFNFYAFAKRITAQSDLAFSDLFPDPMHVRRELGRFMGQVALTYMQSVANTGRPQVAQTYLTYQPLSIVPFEVVTTSGERQVKHRETKLAAADLLRIAPGGQLRFEVHEAVDVIGMTCNAVRTIGNLHEAVDTKDPLMRIKASALFARARGLTLVTLPITRPLRVGSGEAVIGYDFDGTTTDTQPDPALELSGFVLRHVDTPRPVHVATHAMAPVALEDTVSDANLTALVDMLKATPAA